MSKMLDPMARIRAMVEFHVNEHNTKMPHPAFSGQTPHEMFFGTGAKVPEELALAKAMRGLRAWPTIVRCLAGAVWASKPAFRKGQFLTDFHTAG